ncbi:MAG: hypothetical protein IT372_40430 [Polyangiaceae bacterium]|nr:hypothetical protein [Polyangiaceae bacterium]
MGMFKSIEAIIQTAGTLLAHGAAVADVAVVLVEEKGVTSELAWLAVKAAQLL